MTGGVRFCLWVLLLAGCERVFKLDELPDARPADGAIDSTDATMDMPPALCAQPQVFDDFSGNTLPYCPWGDSYGDDMLQHDGVLDITLPGTTANMTGCTINSPQNFTEAGVILHVPQVNVVDNAYTTLTIRGTGTASFDAAVVYKAGSLRFGSSMGGYASVVGPPPPWWRLRAFNNQTEAMISNDGVTWTSIGKGTAPPPTQIAVDIGTGLDVAPTVPGGQAQLSLFAICN